jgi:hypothetical protein
VTPVVRGKTTGRQTTIKPAEQELKMLLKAWKVAYRKESFYNGLSAFLEISRDGETPSHWLSG